MALTHRAFTSPGIRRSRGITIVETMVGLAVAMVLLAGALKLYVDNLVHSRRLLAEVRLTQDLRAAADLVARDLRRSGYWGNAIQGTRTLAGGATAVQNPYSQVWANSTAGVIYSFSRDTAENNALDSAEHFGFRVRDGALQMMLGEGVWHDLTDTHSMVLDATGFGITVRETSLPLGHLCPTACAASDPGCPSTQLRHYDVRLSGQSVRDPDVVREFISSVRVRNDRLSGQCPA
jgi:type IV pilus assembly protein PilW